MTLTVANVAGQEGSCNATVTVENNVPPTAKCKFVATNFNEEGIATIAPRQVNNKSVDACGVLIPTEALSLDEDTFLATDGTEPRTVTLTVTDVRGMIDQCTATVYFNDNVDPVCRNISALTIYLDETGAYELFPEELDNGSSDNTG
ncbi:MAG: hypothetical protein H6559_32030 [Lewinellaceae bacterium]|nr:hypothetical protein [Lewinellaceae bacterium]